MRRDLLPASRMTRVLGFLAIVAALRLGESFVVPLALASLISLVLLPLVKRLGRIGLGNVPAVAAATSAAVVLLIGFGWVVTLQVSDLAEKVPQYRSNIVRKAASFGPAGAYIERTTDAIQQLGDEIVTSTEMPGDELTPGAATPDPAYRDDGAPTVPRPAKRPPTPTVGVHVVDSPNTPLGAMTGILVSWVEEVGTAIVVLILVVFLLVYRQDLGDRLIHIFGDARVNITSTAMSDAAENVSKYLTMLSFVNAGFGLVVTAGLFALDVPNAILWGLVAGLLRFIPLVGAWLGLLAPLVLSLAVFDSWAQPLILLGAWTALEAVTANVVEPLVYGKRTAVSPLGVMLGTLFWTWLWGPAGLVLAVPMTVSVFVLGKNLPQLAFLNTLFGSGTVLEPRMQLYHRLLGHDADAAVALVDSYRTGRSLVDVCDALFLPALALSRADPRRGVDDERGAAFLANLRTVIEDAATVPLEDVAAAAAGPAEATPAVPAHEAPPVLVVPADDTADELVGLMLRECLATDGIAAVSMPAGTSSAEQMARAAELGARVIVVSALHPTAAVVVRLACKRIRSRCPAAKIVVGSWTAGEDAAVLQKRLAPDVGTVVVSSVAEAMSACERGVAPSSAVKAMPAGRGTIAACAPTT